MKQSKSHSQEIEKASSSSGGLSKYSTMFRKKQTANSDTASYTTSNSQFDANSSKNTSIISHDTSHHPSHPLSNETKLSSSDIKDKITELLIGNEQLLLLSICQCSLAGESAVAFSKGIISMLNQYGSDICDSFVLRIMKEKRKTHSEKNRRMTDMLRDNSMATMIQTAYTKSVSTNYVKKVIETPLSETLELLGQLDDVEPQTVKNSVRREAAESPSATDQKILDCCLKILDSIVSEESSLVMPNQLRTFLLSLKMLVDNGDIEPSPISPPFTMTEKSPEKSATSSTLASSSPAQQENPISQQAELQEQQEQDIFTTGDRVVGAILFLRLFVPAITSPESVGLKNIKPKNSNIRKWMILIGKILNGFCSEADFKHKEPNIGGVSEFIRLNKPRVKNYIDLVTGVPPVFKRPDLTETFRNATKITKSESIYESLMSTPLETTQVDFGQDSTETTTTATDKSSAYQSLQNSILNRITSHTTSGINNNNNNNQTIMSPTSTTMTTATTTTVTSHRNLSIENDTITYLMQSQSHLEKELPFTMMHRTMIQQDLIMEDFEVLNKLLICLKEAENEDKESGGHSSKTSPRLESSNISPTSTGYFRKGKDSSPSNKSSRPELGDDETDARISKSTENVSLLSAIQHRFSWRNFWPSSGGKSSNEKVGSDNENDTETSSKPRKQKKNMVTGEHKRNNSVGGSTGDVRAESQTVRDENDIDGVLANEKHKWKSCNDVSLSK